MDQNTDQSLKCPLSQDSDYLPPNRPARPRQMDGSMLETSNTFSPIMSAKDIMSPKPNK